ncbi:MAG: hypothetical protein P3W97_010705, partial [Tepidimonas sp.]|nr:hypothetical protein [Tepidimonas sp.]
MNPLLACWDVPIALTKVRAKPTTRDAALQWFDTGTRVVRSEVASSTAWNRNLLLAPSALEPSMNVDDAGALGKGGLKVEGALNRDDKVRGGELVFGFAPIDDLEVGLGLARATDHDLDPSTKLRGTGIGY